MSTSALDQQRESRRAKALRIVLPVIAGVILFASSCMCIWFALPVLFRQGSSKFDGYPSWSPDGSRIVFQSNRDGDSDIYVMNADGSNAANVTSDYARKLHSLIVSIDMTDDRWPRWSPDGNAIVFASGRDNAMMTFIAFDLYVMAPSGASVSRLTSPPISISDGRPDWSPHGDRIVFSSDRTEYRNIFMMNADGSNIQPLTDSKSENDMPSWSPGRRIAFGSDRDGDMDIYVMGVDGSNLVQLTNAPGSDVTPDWSPLGDQIVFASDHGGDQDIYVMKIDGTDVSRLTDQSAFATLPRWSPDGSHIAFVSASDGDADIYIMDADGSHVTQLTHD